MFSVVSVNADRHDYVTITQDALDLTAPPPPPHPNMFNLDLTEQGPTWC